MLRVLLRPIELTLTHLAVRLAPSRLMHGFLVACSSVGVECETFFAKCGTALQLIRTHDPHRFRRISHDVRVIALSNRGSSYYEPRLRAVLIDVDVLKREPEYIATTLVHEGIHARLYWSGVRNYRRIPERHERLCIAQEIQFASRLPHCERLVEELRASLDHPWWNEAGRRAQIRRFATRNKLPGWVEWCLVRFGPRWPSKSAPVAEE